MLSNGHIAIVRLLYKGQTSVRASRRATRSLALADEFTGAISSGDVAGRLRNANGSLPSGLWGPRHARTPAIARRRAGTRLSRSQVAKRRLDDARSSSWERAIGRSVQPKGCLDELRLRLGVRTPVVAVAGGQFPFQRDVFAYDGRIVPQPIAERHLRL